MFPKKMLEVLNHEGVVSIVTQGENEPHIVNTWNSYLKISEDGKIIFPAGTMKVTEANVNKNNKVLMTLGSREVQGFHSMGTGFLISGTAAFIKEGTAFEEVKSKFPWSRAAVEVKVDSATQTL
ncbi:pyridoxamine 5'-phosphate oxidase family protein [Clostridium sp. YIM B02515]|uniref:Pyridoxamine 5'-phosphate oxidase family protein n=1 Tax=Clostridium rhizosphaerae TaxID=2803861 RepID=A0ABS1T5D4_9CLOT|nr:pyridoxamine 5'-phosphate oxidase family protein [Clostridium rhizosphaerae]MBL4934466.1 pyridoxamine 5'-phosphate oxidase family protein [Clostridium rhizosphaerae]